MDEINIEDGSNDKAYFTMVPNIVLNHSSAVDQALYMQMKRFAGEKSGGGYCTASRRTLMGKLKIGPKALKSSIQYLVDHKWIDNVGSRSVMTNGGAQDVQIYRVNDIWKLNVEHYKGASESAPLSKGGDERRQGADERSKGGDERHTTKNNTKKVYIGEQARKTYERDSDLPEKPQPVIPSPYSVESTHAAWQSGERRLQILDWYLTKASLWKKATTKPKLQAIMARHNNAAVRIAKADWSLGEINKVFSKIRETDFLEGEWTLETVEKYLTK